MNKYPTSSNNYKLFCILLYINCFVLQMYVADWANTVFNIKMHYGFLNFSRSYFTNFYFMPRFIIHKQWTASTFMNFYAYEIWLRFCRKTSVYFLIFLLFLNIVWSIEICNLEIVFTSRQHSFKALSNTNLSFEIFKPVIKICI